MTDSLTNKVEINSNYYCCISEKCDGPSAWYLKCEDRKRKCDFKDKVATGGGPVCSRITNIDGETTHHTFPSMLDLLQFTCQKMFYCGLFPSGHVKDEKPNEEDLKKSLVFNYNGACVRMSTNL